ncbi:transglycosylase SLT domain/LysM domain [Bacteroidales bacterium 6E]|nr:transglycosylase SLT domain/LysM domain [Bacteroidales bacterium 6E]
MMKPMRTLMFALTLLFVAGSLNANNNNIRRIGQYLVTYLDTNSYETVFIEPDEVIRAMFAEKLDSMVHNLYYSNVFLADSSEFDFTIPANMQVSDSLIIARLQSLPSEVPLSFNKVVRDFIEMYTYRKRGQVEMMLGRAAFYFPIFEEIFDKYNLPHELKYLSIIESALNPVATSRVGAVGLWQFMYGTAKYLNMDVSTFIDERRDVLKATDAAARYLKQLYDIYGDWHLVIAAYNCGPGNVNKAIRRSGGKTDYWQVYYALPRETRGYVPAYIAATYVMNYHKEHQLVPRLPEIPIATDTLMINDYLNLKQVADNLDLDLSLLREMNPMYRRDVIPATEEKSYPLRIPLEQVSAFIDNSEQIFSHEREAHFPDNSLVAPKTTSSGGGSYAPADIKGKTRITYTVKSGDNPGYIARWYNVDLRDLRAWNNLNRNLIRVGQKLTIYVPEDKKDHYERINLLSFSAKQEMVGQPVPTNAIASQSASASNASDNTPSQSQEGEFEYYTVKNGDNLWSIAQKYPGISNSDIMRLNNISNVRNLKVGQKLKIRPKS